MKVEAEGFIAELLSCGQDALPELLYLAESEFGRYAEHDGKRTGAGKAGIQRPGDQGDALVAEMPEGKIDKVEVYPFQQQAALAEELPAAGLYGSRRKGLEARTLEEAPDGLDASHLFKILHTRKYRKPSPKVQQKTAGHYGRQFQINILSNIIS